MIYMVTDMSCLRSVACFFLLIYLYLFFLIYHDLHGPRHDLLTQLFTFLGVWGGSLVYIYVFYHLSIFAWSLT